MSDIKRIKCQTTKKKVVQLYKKGLSLRAITEIVKMSHEWVRKVLIEAVDK